MNLTDIICFLNIFSGPHLRIEMMQQIPQVANYLVQDCQMNTAMSDYILPTVLKSLTDPCLEVCIENHLITNPY